MSSREKSRDLKHQDMKKIMTIAFVLLFAVGAYAQEGKRLYNKYSDTEGVSAVYISPAMFKLMGQLPDINVETAEGENVDLAPLVRTFTGFYMLNISKESAASAGLYKEVTAMVNKGDYELLMEVKDSGDNLRMYTAGDEKTVESFVFMAHSDSDIQFICIDGAMSREEVNTLIAHLAQ